MPRLFIDRDAGDVGGEVVVAEGGACEVEGGVAVAAFVLAGAEGGEGLAECLDVARVVEGLTAVSGGRPLNQGSVPQPSATISYPRPYLDRLIGQLRYLPRKGSGGLLLYGGMKMASRKITTGL